MKRSVEDESVQSVQEKVPEGLGARQWNNGTHRVGGYVSSPTQRTFQTTREQLLSHYRIINALFAAGEGNCLLQEGITDRTL